MTLAEVTVAATVMGMTLTAALGISGAVTRAADKNGIENRQVGDARVALDEVLYQTRSASAVLTDGTLAGFPLVRTSTNGSTVVLAAPGYNPASSTVILPTVTDYVIFQYDAGNKRLLQTTRPGTGSVRPVRSSYVLAKNVSGFRCTFRARDYHLRSGGQTSFPLKATLATGASTVVLVDGVETPHTRSTSGTFGTVSIGSAVTGTHVEVIYEVNPTSFATDIATILTEGDRPALEAVVELEFAETDSRRKTRTLTLNGAARLRNRRG